MAKLYKMKDLAWEDVDALRFSNQFVELTEKLMKTNANWNVKEFQNYMMENVQIQNLQDVNIVMDFIMLFVVLME